MLLLPRFLSSTLVVAAAAAAAQQNLTTLVKSRPELSNLSAYFDLHPDIIEVVLRRPNTTFLAPSDEAFAKAAPPKGAFGTSFNIIDLNATGIAALFEYHTLVPFLRSTDFSDGPHFIPTTLVDPAYTTLARGQVVVGSAARGQQPILTSGLQSISTVVVPDLECEGGIVHIVDNFLTIPPSGLESLAPLGLTAAEGALTKATTLGSELPRTNVTLFVPSNAAFEAVGSVLNNISKAQLSNILAYHVVPDVVEYLVPFHNVSLPTLISEDLHIVAEDGKIFVNSAEAAIRNVLTAEGVLHVIDNVLNPSNTTAVPDYMATSQAPAFSGATPLSGGVVPFTTGLSAGTTPLGKGLSTSAKAGIGIGVALGVALVAALFCFRRWKRVAQISSPSKRESGDKVAAKVVGLLPMQTVHAKQRLDGQALDSDLDARQGRSRAKDEGWG